MAELKLHSSKFFEVQLAMQETQEDGVEKMAKKNIVVDALSFGEAEKKAFEEMSYYASGELKIVNINPASYGEVYTSDDEKDDKFYKCKLSFITIDEKTEKEKKSKVTYLVQAGSTNKAQSYIDNYVMKGSMLDYETCSISDTPIFDCFFHSSDSEKKEADE